MGDDFQINLGENFERQLCCVPNVNVFKIPPLNQAEGYRCTGWEGNQLWSGRLRVLVKGQNARIVLDDANTLQVFAECPLNDEHAVDRVLDSSRYFVLRVVNGTRHAFIGMGMKERNEAFDFNVSIDEARRTVKEYEQSQNAPQDQGPPVIQSSGTDYSLHGNQKITINIPAGGASTRKKRTVANNQFKL